MTPSPMATSIEHAAFIRQLGRMNAEQILHALAEAKTGQESFEDYLGLEVAATAEGALKAFVAALEKYQADKVIGDSLK